MRRSEMKLPNGFGTITQLSGNRRNPYWARITIGWEYVNGKSVQKRKNIGYIPTRKAAYNALDEYNRSPYDVDVMSITLGEVYKKWSAEKYPSLSQSSIHGYEAGWRIAEPLADMPMQKVNLEAMQKTLDKAGKNYPIQKRYKSVLSQLFDYAFKHDIVDSEKRDKVQFIQIDKDKNPNALTRVPFSGEEIEKLWKSATDTSSYVNVVLMLIYSGVRVDELLELRKENVHLEQQYFNVVESKTDAGVRAVPIADKVLPYFEYWYNFNSDCDFLICTRSGGQMVYRNFRSKYWLPMMKKLEMNHLPHETRHTCISLLTAAGIDERVIEKIVGHKANNVTRDVYTHVDIPVLLDAINKI